LRAALTTPDGTRPSADEATICQMLAAGTPFWLDLQQAGGELAPLLNRVFAFHPLAVEDCEQFGQRPKVDDYDNYVLLVMYGTSGPSPDDLIEVHCFYSEKYLVTVHHTPCAELDNVAERLVRLAHVERPLILVLYAVLHALIDSFFPVLSDLDDDIDDLEDAILEQPSEYQLGRIFQMKRSLIAMRKVITPARDTLASITTGLGVLPGMTLESERYFRDVYDHLIRISDLVDSYRDLLSGALDTHLSTVSNRLNVVMKQLTLVATVFLPLTFLTGFFGQNFETLVENIAGPIPFFVLGIGLEVLAFVALIVWFRRSGWMGGETAPPPDGPKS
jgi:magnesium transporter